ncbi:MAG: site-specific DNA-methyltransferase [Verrucomicrobia bacterium]|nr:site-specific DNA-methyltransferase [Verrucomicrobiota bacterium]
MSAATIAATKVGPKERRFLDALRDLFVGVKVDGRSGFINLMRIKAAYFLKVVEPALMEDLARALKDFPEFREELFDKLHAFFSRYFSRSGSICFAYTPQHMSVYEKVYTDEQDVVLFWKTHMLYYVKTDRLFRDLKVKVDSHAFFFDCANLEHKKSNEKRELVFAFDKIEKDGVIRFAVTHSERGRTTKTDEILKALKKAGQPVKEAALDKATRVFARQSEVDYFINKDARGFLREQLDLWMYQYVFKDETRWTEARIRQLQALKDIAFKLIDFISQFEDELVRIWNKPKFVRGSHYVVTLDRLAAKDGGFDLIADALKHAGMKAQVAEWQELNIVEKDFDAKAILEGRGKDRKLADAWRSLPLDTKHFKFIELRLLSLFDNLDEELDGRLIKSENYQALNTLRQRYKESVDAIYVDPPYNTGTESSEFIYANAYQHSSWLTFIENRFNAALPLLNPRGILCVTIDDYEYRHLSSFFDGVTRMALLGTAVIRNKPQGRPTASGFSANHEYALFYGDKGRATVGRLPREGKKAERYPENDAKGVFAWANLRKTGSGSDKEDREKQFYPIYVKGEKIRVPAMEWDEPKRIWIVIDSPAKGEEILLPIDNEGNERVWNLSPERVVMDMDDLQVVRSEDGTQIHRKYRPNSEGALPGTWWDDSAYSASESGTKVLQDIIGEDLSFPYPKSIFAVRDCLRAANVGANKKSLVMDFFGGSGTTAHAVMLLNQEDQGSRKFVVVEMGDHFEKAILKRLKKLAFCTVWRNAKPVDRKAIGSVFFKYFSLEQYEDAIGRAVYSEDEDLFRNTKTNPYSQYVFFRDEKMARALEMDYTKDEVKVHLDRLYPDIDLAETFSCVMGKWIKRVTADEVEFADGSKQSLNKPDWRLLKPLIFWGGVV